MRKVHLISDNCDFWQFWENIIEDPLLITAPHRSEMPKVKINYWTGSSISSVYSPFCFQVCGLLFWSFPYYSYFLAQIIPNHFYGLTRQHGHFRFHYHFHSFDVPVLVHWFAGCDPVYPERNLIDFNSQDFLNFFK